MGLVHELDRKVEYFVVHGLHPLGIERAGILDLLFANLAPARHYCRVVRVGRPGMDHVARADYVQQLLRVSGVRGVFHGVEVIEIAEELVKPVDGWKELVTIAKVVLSELARGVAHGLENGSNRRGLRWQPEGRASLADRGHARTNRKLTGDEGSATRRAACLGIVVGEQHAFG